jgi:hypothetical protein
VPVVIALKASSTLLGRDISASANSVAD